MSLLKHKLFDRNYLIFILVALIALRFAVLPILEWQQSRISEIRSKQVQLGKTIDLVNSYSDYQQMALELKAEKSKLAPLFYEDSDDTRLQIQKDIEQVLNDHNLTIERFNWVLDDRSDSGLRTLRVLVGFNGQLDAVMRVLLDISKHRKVARQVEWRQNLTKNRKTDVGQSRGHVTLEFYAYNSLQLIPDQKQKVANKASVRT
jgi:uncharacterized protein (DUF934 family)